jgi:hypothetical protein
MIIARFKYQRFRISRQSVMVTMGIWIWLYLMFSARDNLKWGLVPFQDRLALTAASFLACPWVCDPRPGNHWEGTTVFCSGDSQNWQFKGGEIKLRDRIFLAGPWTNCNLSPLMDAWSGWCNEEIGIRLFGCRDSCRRNGPFQSQLGSSISPFVHLTINTTIWFETEMKEIQRRRRRK